MEKPRPLKRFGQNYLTDHNTIQKIVNTFEVNSEDIVVEIGPGRGALTALLQNKMKKYYAVEIDRRVIDDLRDKFSNVEFINQDFLTINLASFANNEKLRIIGNIPYNITSPILFKLIEERESVKDAMIMTQYEVAKRIVAKPRTKDYGILSVLLNYFAEAEFCFKISPNVFYPKPNVDSAIIKINFSKVTDTEVNDKHFIQVVKAAFGNRRKTLKNSLGNSVFKDVILSQEEFDISRRAEELTIPEFIELAKLIDKKLRN